VKHREADVRYVQDLLRQHSGIVLEDSKEYLLAARLGPLMRECGSASIEELVGTLQSTPPGLLHRRAAEALVNGETLFFRDLHPFEALRTVILPRLVEARRRERRLLVWSAGCSTGQEPYSLAMLLREHFAELQGWDLRILASDFSQGGLAQARSGLYSQFDVNRGLPAAMLAKYFEKKGSDWEVKSELRRMVEFRELNLIREWPGLPPVDLLLLRNVMLYHDEASRRWILDRVRRVLRPDGRLVLGAAETTSLLDGAFEPEYAGKSVCFRPRGGPASP
jgi:chemotaxis protein methyltransferase CheR